MKQIHYFQRYSQRENVVTNNTLLLFNRLYNSSILKFKNFLYGLSEVEIEIGLRITQQQKAKDSIPDGFIEQTSLRIVIETKLSNQFNPTQLKNHLKAFNNEEQQFLLCIGTSLPEANLNKEIIEYVSNFNKSNNKNIKLVFTTFKNIISQFSKSINDFDLELKALIEDFQDFCISENLISKDNLIMRMPLSGKSFEVNLKSSLYFDPAERGYSQHSFIGLYKEKAIRAIGRLENIIIADLIGDKLQIKESTNEITTEHEQKLRNSVVLAHEINGWNIAQGHKFYIVDKFIEIEFKKESPRAPFGTRYFDLNEFISNLNPTSDLEFIATELNGRVWQ
jgi:hypothetical protein